MSLVQLHESNQRAHKLAQQMELEINEMIDKQRTMTGSESERGQELHEFLTKLQYKRQRLREETSSQLTELRAKEAELVFARERLGVNLGRSVNAVNSIPGPDGELKQIGSDSADSQKLEELKLKLERDRELNAQRHDEIVAEFVRLEIASKAMQCEQETLRKDAERMKHEKEVFARSQSQEHARLLEEREKYKVSIQSLAKKVESVQEQAVRNIAELEQKYQTKIHWLTEQLAEARKWKEVRKSESENDSNCSEPTSEPEADSAQTRSSQREQSKLDEAWKSLEKRKSIQEMTWRQDRAQLEREREEMARQEMEAKRKLRAYVQRILHGTIPAKVGADRLTKELHRMKYLKEPNVSTSIGLAQRARSKPVQSHKNPKEARQMELENLRIQRRGSIQQRAVQYSKEMEQMVKEKANSHLLKSRKTSWKKVKQQWVQSK